MVLQEIFQTYEKRQAERAHPRALSPPAFHITPNPLHSPCTSWLFVRASPAPHKVQPNQTELGPAPPSPTLRLLWSCDIPLLAFYTGHSIRVWGSGVLFSFWRLFLWLFISQASLAAMKMKNVLYYHPKISRTNCKCYKQDRWMKLCMETLPQEAPFILWRDCLGKGKANEISFLTNCQD